MRIERTLASRTRLNDTLPGVRALSPIDQAEFETAYSDAEDFSPYLEQALGYSLETGDSENASGASLDEMNGMDSSEAGAAPSPRALTGPGNRGRSEATASRTAASFGKSASSLATSLPLNRSLAAVLEASELTRGQSTRTARTGLRAYAPSR